MHIETLLTIPTESNITHPTERSYLLFLSFLPDELKKLVQNKDRKNGLFSNKSTVTNGINLINLNLTQRRKSLNSIMKISSTSISLKIGILKVKNSRIWLELLTLLQRLSTSNTKLTKSNSNSLSQFWDN